MRRIASLRTVLPVLALLATMAAGTAPAQTPTTNTILVSSGSFNFTHQFGNNTPPAEQILNVLSTSGNVGYSITFAPTTPANVTPWIIVAPVDTSGLLQTPSVVRIVPVPGNLPVGTYTGELTLTAANVTNPSIKIPVTLRIVQNSELELSSKTLNFTSVTGSAPPAQQVQINTTGSPLNFTATTAQANGPAGWLVVDPSTGTTNRAINISVNPAGLSAGTYNGTVNIASGSAANSPQQIQVTYTVTNAPTLSATPAGLNFNFQIGTSAPAAQSVEVRAGTQNVPLTITADPGATTGWLSVTPANGNTPATLSVSVNPTGLAAGTYNGNINVTSAGLGTLQIPVRLNVSTSPLLNISASRLNFTAQAGQSAATQTVNLTSTSTPLPFTFELEPAGTWLIAAATSNTTPAGLTVGTITRDLTPGTYNGKITIRSPQAGNNPQVIDVVVTVSSQVVLQVTPNTLNFSGTVGGATPAFQSFNVTSSDNTPQPFTITRTTTGPNADWLVVTPTSGTTPANGIQVAINPTGLAAGNYTGSIVVTPTNAGPPQTIQVNLTLAGATQFTAAPASLTFSQVVNGSAPPAQTVQLTSNPSGLAFVAQIPSTASWLSVAANQNTTPATLTFTANGANLQPGTYNTAVTILAGNTAQQTIPVTLTVGSSATLTVQPTTVRVFEFATGGTAPAAQQLAFSSNGPAIDFGVTGSANWIRLSPVEGRTPATVNLTVDPAGLAPGTYEGQVTVTANGVNLPAPIPVRLIVTGPPAPSITDFQNGASFLPSAAAPGQIITIRGANLGPALPGASFTLNAQGRVPTVVAGVRVLFDGIPGPVIFASRNQVNAIVPYALTGRFSTRVQVEVNNQLSNVLELRVVDSAPGIFTVGDGRGRAALLNQDSTVNNPNNAAARGSIVQIFATGEGQTRPEGIDGFVPVTLQDLRSPLLQVTVRIGGQPAEIVYAGSAPSAVLGLFQINARVPQNIGTGNQPIEIQVGTALSQSGVTLAIR